MTQIGSINLATSIPQTGLAEARPADQATQGVDDKPETEAAGDASGAGSASLKSSKDTEEADDKRTESVAELQKQIEQLQKQLARAQQELAAIRTSNMDDEQKGTLAAALQVQVAMLNTSLMSLMMKLAEAIANENGKILDETGGRLPNAR
jgi:molecular chaperone GrpE (heat shock protein)